MITLEINCDFALVKKPFDKVSQALEYVIKENIPIKRIKIYKHNKLLV